ncbi:MAG: DNA-processing protein DprA [Deltaproteobacteria bacterium]|nr:DNA-processing protein DprA [Deltaproteobacteria bacterium]
MKAALTEPRRQPKLPRYRAPSTMSEVYVAEVLGPLTPAECRFAPSSVWLAGDPGLLGNQQLRVAVVGSREASSEGLRRAAKLAAQLAHLGIVVVSGLAAGVDGAAHNAALEAGGRTIGVIGTPLTLAYPRAHAALQECIYREHLLVSQFAPHRRGHPSDFVRRNRLMALLSHASVVVEAGDSSGTLSQAAETVRLGRPLFIMRSTAERVDLEWPRRFLDKGAIVLESVEQLAARLRPEPAGSNQGVLRLVEGTGPLVEAGGEVEK